MLCSGKKEGEREGRGRGREGEREFREAYSGTRTIIGVDANVELGNLPRSENIGHLTTGEGHPTARAQAFRGLLKAKKLFACNTFGRVTDIAANHFTHTQRNGGRTSQKDFILDTWGPPSRSPSRKAPSLITGEPTRF